MLLSIHRPSVGGLEGTDTVLASFVRTLCFSNLRACVGVCDYVSLCVCVFEGKVRLWRSCSVAWSFDVRFFSHIERCLLPLITSFCLIEWWMTNIAA